MVTVTYSTLFIRSDWFFFKISRPEDIFPPPHTPIFSSGPSDDSGQSAHLGSVDRVFAVRLKKAAIT